MAGWGPYFFNRRRRFREERLLGYIHREHQHGRHLTDILEDAYVKRCGSAEVGREAPPLEPVVDALGEVLVAPRICRRAQLVLTDAAELRHECAQWSVAPEQRRDPHRVRRELRELRIELPLAAVAPEIPPLVGAAGPHRLWLTASTLLPSGSRTKAPT